MFHFLFKFLLIQTTSRILSNLLKCLENLFLYLHSWSRCYKYNLMPILFLCGRYRCLSYRVYFLAFNLHFDDDLILFLLGLFTNLILSLALLFIPIVLLLTGRRLSWWLLLFRSFITRWFTILSLLLLFLFCRLILDGKLFEFMLINRGCCISHD